MFNEYRFNSKYHDFQKQLYFYALPNRATQSIKYMIIGIFKPSLIISSNLVTLSLPNLRSTLTEEENIDQRSVEVNFGLLREILSILSDLTEKLNKYSLQNVLRNPPGLR